ncbi:MAG: hypothetical protein IH881_04735 [Myxococcales bacterium]|nr:hypothetical protein [Myxococcales bacterium]
MLHTRISEQLSQDIRRLAEDLRVPVSNLVRNVLEEVFTAVENVSDDVGDFFEDVIDEAEGVRERIRNQQRAARRQWRDARRSRHGHRSTRADVEEELRRDEAVEAGHAPSDANRGKAAAADKAGDVLGWQPIVLNQAVSCAVCNTAIAPRENAFMTISQGGGLGKVVCPSCTGS